MAPVDPRAPVIVGAGQLSRRGGADDGLGDLAGPVELTAEALRRAGADSATGDRLLRRADSVRCVATASWIFRDLAALVAPAVGATPRETVQTAQYGGDGPQRLVGDTARAIAEGRLDVALIGGAETVATSRRAQRDGAELPWPVQDESVAPTRVLGSDRGPVNDAETAVGLFAPINVYALIETAIRARSGASPEEHLRRIAALWARFSEVAAGNQHAWLPRAFSAEELATPGSDNRPVSAPYLKLLTANIQVDQAAGLILCSAQTAADAGVPRDRWVFVHASAHAQDEWFVSERADLAASPAIRAAGRAALEHAGVAAGDVEHVDLYSCFPAAVQIGAAELGLPLDDPGRPLTVTGGLTFAGGPGNDYTTHAIATLVGLLREDPAATGLATALGWYLTKHAIGVYGAHPPRRPFADIDANAAMDAPPARAATADHTGPAVLEAYTAPYGRDGAPEAAVLSAITPDGRRALRRTDDPDAIGRLLDGDPLGEDWQSVH